MVIWTDIDTIMNRLHPQLLKLGFRFVQSNRVYWLERDIEDGTEAYGPFGSVEAVEWSLGAIEAFEKGV